MRATLVAQLLMALALCAANAANAAPKAPATLRLGFADGVFTSDEGPRAMDLARRAGGSLVRLNAEWSGIAATRPQDETDPADPAYRFAALDAAVREATARNLRPFILAYSAPTWAEGRGRPGSAVAGTWKPNAAAYGRFGTALARRYSGHFTPTGASSPLPRVRTFQAGNEPNLDTYLAPQWERRGGRWRAFAPGRYRSMLNAFTSAVKRVRADNFVVTAGTSPFGGPVGDWRRRPLAFWRDVLCVSRPCANRARFDAISHHPYSSSRAGPLVDSYHPDDMPVAGMHRLVSLLRRSEDRRRVGGVPRRHRIWVTELGYESNPPDPDGISTAKQTLFLRQALYALWRTGVDTLTWYQMLDAPPNPQYGFAGSVQTAVYFRSGKPKPAAQAFAFPFVTDPKNRRVYWGLAPKAGRVSIQRRTTRGWSTLTRATASSRRMFRGRGSWRRGAVLRALQNGRASMPWTVR